MLRRVYWIRNEAPPEGGAAGGGSLYDQKPETPPEAGPVKTEATEVKPDWNSAEWKNFLPDDFKNDPSLKAIKDLPSLAKSYVHAQKMVGADKIIVPNKFADDTEWQQVYNKLGKPEASEKYDIKLPEKSEISEDFMKGLKETAFKAHLNNKQAGEFVNFWNDQLTNAKAKIQEIEAAEVTKEISEFKKEMGAAYDSKMKAATLAWKEFGGDDIFDYLKNSGLDTNTRLAKVMIKIGEALAEDKPIDSPSNSAMLTPGEAKAELSQIMNNPAYFDKNLPDHKRVVERALELRSLQNFRQ